MAINNFLFNLLCNTNINGSVASVVRLRQMRTLDGDLQFVCSVKIRKLSMYFDLFRVTYIPPCRNDLSDYLQNKNTWSHCETTVNNWRQKFFVVRDNIHDI